MDFGHDCSRALVTIAKLLVDIVENRFGISDQSKELAEKVLKLLEENGVQITEWLLKKLSVLISDKQVIEPVYTEVKAIVKKALDAKPTGFIGIFGKVVTFIGYNCIRFFSGKISGKELISQTHRSVDKSSAEPLVGALVGGGVGIGVGAVAGAGGVSSWCNIRICCTCSWYNNWRCDWWCGGRFDRTCCWIRLWYVCKKNEKMLILLLVYFIDKHTI